MSDYLPFEIQVEIIKNLPVKSLTQARSVSKAWKSLIDSSDFILDHSVRHTQPQRLFLWYRCAPQNEEDRLANGEKYVCFVDDDTFPQHSFKPSVPLFAKRLDDSVMVGSCRGLFCLHGYHFVSPNYGPMRLAVIWNPSIRKSLAIVVPYVSDFHLETGFGFGVCPGTSDPKIVKITQYRVWPTLGSSTCIRGQVKVFTLSSGVWRSPSSILPRKSIEFIWSQVVSGGFIYWLANDRIGGAFGPYILIMSFDLTSEEFSEVSLPHSLAFTCYLPVALVIRKLRESLVVIECRDFRPFSDDGYGIWMMEDGGSKSFIKLFTIRSPDASIKAILGFRKSGEPLLKTQDEYFGYTGKVELAVYEPCSKNIKCLVGIYGWPSSLFANYYMETLLLLNYPENLIYYGTEDDGKFPCAELRSDDFQNK